MQPLYVRFLELVSAALLQREVDASLFAGMDEKEWRRLLEYGNIQHMSALLADAALTLPTEVQPPLAVKLSWILMREKVEEANAKLNQEVIHLAQDYERIGCPMVLLKGQGNALCYPIPDHRTPGDIDAFLYLPGSYDKANEWAKAQGFPMEKEQKSVQHWGFEYHTARIENHCQISYSYGKRKYERIIDNWVQKAIEKNDFHLLSINNQQVRVLAPTFNVFFIFYHLYHHFSTTGVGIRQLCDWVMALHYYADKIDIATYQSMCKQLDLLKASQIFAQLSIKYLNIPAALFPFELGKKYKITESVMQDILYGGHFGFYHKRMRQQPKGLWSGRWHRYKFIIFRILRFASIAPQHSILLPLYMLINRLKIEFGLKK